MHYIKNIFKNQTFKFGKGLAYMASKNEKLDILVDANVLKKMNSFSAAIKYQ